MHWAVVVSVGRGYFHCPASSAAAKFTPSHPSRTSRSLHPAPAQLAQPLGISPARACTHPYTSSPQASCIMPQHSCVTPHLESPVLNRKLPSLAQLPLPSAPLPVPRPPLPLPVPTSCELHHTPAPMRDASLWEQVHRLLLILG